MVFKEIVSILINPVTYIFICMMFVVFSKKNLKILLFFAALVLYIISIPYSSILFQQKWKMNDTYSSEKKYDAVVVLAGVTDSDRYIYDTKAVYIPDDYFYSSPGTERVLAGVYFVKSGHAKDLMFGRWFFKGFDESEVTGKYARSIGLKPEHFIVYGNVKRTLDEAREARLYVEKKQLKKILLVTSQSHMRRSYGLFKKQGLSPDLFSTNKDYRKMDWRAFFPSAGAFSDSYNAIYELAGYVVYYVLGDLR
jgi:uncharacterized SAM-binding protein YcdF (DUF218 family)